MRAKYILLAGLAAATMAACTGKTEEYATADGSVKAEHNVKTGEWKVYGPDGKEIVVDYDSMRVVEVGEDGHPKTICYHIGDKEFWIQYYSTMEKRSEGYVVNGVRDGRWTFYHANGKVQSECTFSNGKEEGYYKVYRENGMPYYIGQYTAGVRTGTWEVYDSQGNLVEKREY